MPRKSKPLAAVGLRKLAPGKHGDGNGLYLNVTAEGGRYWRLKYRFGGKEKLLALGVFPPVQLAEAREAAEAARRMLRTGVDPAEQRKAAKAAVERADRGTVAAVAGEWLKFKGKSWSASSARKAQYVVITYLLPALGAEPVASLGSADAAAVLRKLAEHAPDLARKARQYLRGIVAHAILEGLRDDGRVLMLDGVLPKAASGHIAAATLPDELAGVVRAVRKYESPPTRAALLMAAYTAQRPGNVVAMRWDEIHDDGSTAEWRIPAEKMKMRAAHVVPLSKQARALLVDMKAYTAGRAYVFPPLARQLTPHLHRDALSAALRRMGFQGQHATHGFRAAFRTLGRERLHIAEDVLEAQLAHAKRGNVAAAYDRTRHIAARERAMQAWADYLDQFDAAGKVSPIRKTAA